MNSAELAARLGAEWKADRVALGVAASKGHCKVRSSTIKGWHAAFSNGVFTGAAHAATPEEAVRSCLRGVYQRVRVTIDDLEAVLPGVTKP